MPSAPRPVATRVGSVYVHAPFCARRCVYCDFAVTVQREGDLPAWLEALHTELALVEEDGMFSLASELDTLYVGGGTPSLLGSGAMEGLSGLFGPDRLAGSALEWTVEANPESFTDEVATAWARAGVNRISLGLQTFSESGLRWMGRLHGVEGGVRAVDVAGRAGIRNVSVDLIFGLPRSVGRSWDDDLRRVLDLDVTHVSLYGLTVEPETALGRAVREGRESPVDEEQYRDEYLRAAEVLTEAGYQHYEVSNFARAGSEARHNAVYWEGAPYIGLGNSAHSYAHPVRRWNVRDWAVYRMRLLAGTPAEDGHETVRAEALALERIWLALRTRAGVPNPPEGSGSEGVTRQWRRDGLATVEDDRIRLTVEGWLHLDRLAVELDEARRPA
jgi:putative oxygen-independent coproporphyrinogen III oxidase